MKRHYVSEGKSRQPKKWYTWQDDKLKEMLAFERRYSNDDLIRATGMNRDQIHARIKELGLNFVPKGTNSNPTPREYSAPYKDRPNPLALAALHLGSRLRETPEQYFLDGIPANMPKIMKATNAVLRSKGEPMLTTNPLWLPDGE